MKVLVIGTGAVGGFYGALLAKQGVEVSVLARSDYAHIQRHGIAVHSDTGLGDFHFRPAAVVRRGAELPDPPDYVLLCVKVVEGVDRIGLLRDAVGPATAIVLICNGVEVESGIAEGFPQHELISGLAFICVTRLAPGRIWHQAYGRLALGNYPSGVSAKTQALAAAFARSGIACVTSDTIVTARWQKCLWNAAFNPLSVLSGGLATGDILAHQETLVRALMAEVAQIAQAVGHPLPPDAIDRNIDSTRQMPPYKTSMLLDFEAGRPMETEAILGNAVRAGRRAGVALPQLETVYALMKLRELQLTQARAGATHTNPPSIPNTCPVM
ncbi:ketopantoate reductase family protein [Candidatus Methylocalor cossyra]|uniref:2-dehydropantoate 2-reductase n=1 Tax=Candidatus Methylocalor cossyra TaxID=3108543 RepID=A0ABM9NHC1_9GAMM